MPDNCVWESQQFEITTDHGFQHLWDTVAKGSRSGHQQVAFKGGLVFHQTLMKLTGYDLISDQNPDYVQYLLGIIYTTQLYKAYKKPSYGSLLANQYAHLLTYLSCRMALRSAFRKGPGMNQRVHWDFFVYQWL